MYTDIHILYTIVAAFGFMFSGGWVTGVHGLFHGTGALPKFGPSIFYHTRASTLYAMRHGYECTRIFHTAVMSWRCAPNQIPRG
jgi:hypothetical protein